MSSILGDSLKLKTPTPSLSIKRLKKVLLAISLALRPELISPPSWPVFVPLTEGTPIQDLERSPGFLLQGPPGAVGEPGLPGEPGLKVRPDERRETGLVETSSQLTVKSWLRRNGPFLRWDNEFYVFLVQGVRPTRASTPPHSTPLPGNVIAGTSTRLGGGAAHAHLISAPCPSLLIGE